MIGHGLDEPHVEAPAPARPPRTPSAVGRPRTRPRDRARAAAEERADPREQREPRERRPQGRGGDQPRRERERPPPASKPRTRTPAPAPSEVERTPERASRLQLSPGRAHARAGAGGRCATDVRGAPPAPEPSDPEAIGAPDRASPSAIRRSSGAAERRGGRTRTSSRRNRVDCPLFPASSRTGVPHVRRDPSWWKAVQGRLGRRDRGRPPRRVRGRRGQRSPRSSSSTTAARSRPARPSSRA